MSDESNVPPVTYKASHQDVINFLQEKEKVSTCPVCEENNWQLFTQFEMKDGPPVDLAAIGIHPNGSLFVNPPTLPLVAIICNNCAYTRFHAKKLIDYMVSQKQIDLPGIASEKEEDRG